MNSTKLNCGHWFMWQYVKPDSAVYCRKCLIYSYPEGWVEPKIERKRTRDNTRKVTTPRAKVQLNRQEAIEARKRLPQMLADGLSLDTIAKELKISRNTAAKWVRDANR